MYSRNYIIYRGWPCYFVTSFPLSPRQKRSHRGFLTIIKDHVYVYLPLFSYLSSAQLIHFNDEHKRERETKIPRGHVACILNKDYRYNSDNCKLNIENIYTRMTSRVSSNIILRILITKNGWCNFPLLPVILFHEYFILLYTYVRARAGVYVTLHHQLFLFRARQRKRKNDWLTIPIIHTWRQVIRRTYRPIVKILTQFYYLCMYVYTRRKVYMYAFHVLKFIYQDCYFFADWLAFFFFVKLLSNFFSRKFCQ